jgi:hypothetical protein
MFKQTAREIGSDPQIIKYAVTDEETGDDKFTVHVWGPERQSDSSVEAATINWSAIGSVEVELAQKALDCLNNAIGAARRMNEFGPDDPISL